MGTSFNYDDTSHQIIFDHINGGAGSDALQQNGQAWQQLSGEIGGTGKSFVQSAMRVILATRQGAAADAAVAAIGAMTPWMDDVAQIASTAANRSQSQAEHWVTAKNSVPPVPPTPKSAGFSSDPGEWAAEKLDWFPGITSDEEKAQLHQQDAAEQARRAMRVYQSNSNGNVDPGPAFTPPQALDGSVGALPLSAPRVDTAAAAPGMAGGATPAHLLAAHQPAAHQPAAHQPTTQPAVHQPAAYQPAATVSQLAGGPPAGTASNVTPVTTQGMAPDALTLGTGLGQGSAGEGRPVSARGGAARARAAGGAAVGHAGFGPRPTSFGPRPTPSVQPSLDEMSGSRGGAAGSAGATRGAGYGEPFGGGAGGGQHREEDREHRSKYLIYTDSNAIVGDLPPTAPPVIGADY